MTYDPRNPRDDEADSLGAGVIATAALAVLAIAGIAFYVVSSDRTTISATDKPAGIDGGATTTGQGGTSPGMPAPTNPDHRR